MGDPTETAAQAELQAELPVESPATVLEWRIVAAALVCVGRWGVTKTTLEDVAREAGCSRATIYRVFSGGKAAVLQAALRSETRRLRAELAASAGAADTLEDALVAGTVTVTRFLEGSEALNYLLAHEPDVVLPHVAFGRLDWVFALAARYAEPYLTPFLPLEEVGAAAEWITRVVLSFALNPSPAIHLADEDRARAFARTYLVPALGVPSLGDPAVVDPAPLSQGSARTNRS